MGVLSRLLSLFFRMKKITGILLFLHSVLLLTAQKTNEPIGSDSNRIVELSEVIVKSQQTAHQQLIRSFRSTNAATLEEIMSRLPEISLLRRGSYGMEPTIRSFSGGQINVLVDGMRIHGACTDKMDPATIYIEPMNLENLQVQTGSNGFMNGSAIGGTVNMKMAEPDYLHQHKLTGMISSGYQSAAKSIYEAAKLNYSSGKWAFRLSGTYRHNKNYRSGGGERINFSQFEKVNYSFSAKFQQNNYNYLMADVLADDGWNIGYPALPMDVGYAAARIASISLHHNNELQRFSKWQVKIYANQVKHSMDDTKRPFVPMHMDMPGISKTFGIYGETELIINRKQKILFRADGSSTFLKASMTMYQAGQLPMYMLTWPDNRKNQYGISALWLLQVDSTLKVQIATRADYITHLLVSQQAKDQVGIFGYADAGRSDVLKNVSVQGSKKIIKNITTTASISYAERIPTASELYGFYLFNSNDGYDYIGSPRLKTEQSVQAELSAAYNSGANRIQFTYFYAHISNYISAVIDPSFSTMTNGARGVKSYINLPNASVTGIEGTAVLKPFANTNIVSTIRYTIGKDDKKKPLPFIAPLKNISSVRYLFHMTSLQLESEAALQQNRVGEKTGEDKTPGYVLLHARLGYNSVLFKQNMEMQAGVENIFDKHYHEHLDWGNIARPGRNLYLQLKIFF